MGIRIHKMIGYGLDDVKYDNEKDGMIDPRFSKNGYFGSQYAENESEENNLTDEGFDEYLEGYIANEEDNEFSGLKTLKHLRSKAKENEDGYSKKGKYGYKDSIDHCIVFDPEYGLDNVILFMPPVFGKDWQRYDDIIDYYEPSHQDSDGGIGSGITLLKRAIWPFESYVDCRKKQPERVTHTNLGLYLASRNSTEHSQHYAKTLTEEMNFESIEEMRQMIRPIIPEELVILLKYLNVFENEEDIHRLKPMLYWYWG